MKTLTLVATMFAFLSGCLIAGSASAGTIKPGTQPCKRGIVYVCQ